MWGIPNGERLYQFRRGAREARIWSMNFNVVGSLLVAASGHGTVHVFRVGGQQGQGQGSGSSAGRAASSPPASIDSREGVPAMDGGYDAFIEKKKAGGVRRVWPVFGDGVY